MNQSKICKTCKIDQPYSSYYKHKQTADGYRNICKGCHGDNQIRKKEAVSPKVFCKRGEGSMINWSTGCYPGNDACLTCPHPNESNRMSHTLTKEEEDMDKFTINTQGGHGYNHANYK